VSLSIGSPLLPVNPYVTFLHGHSLYAVDAEPAMASTFSVWRGYLRELPTSPSALPAGATPFGIVINWRLRCDTSADGVKRYPRLNPCRARRPGVREVTHESSFPSGNGFMSLFELEQSTAR